jgi:hypothetical protein
MPHTPMLNATPHVHRADPWSQLQAGGKPYVVTCWHPKHGAFDIGILATSKDNALLVASDRLNGTGSIASYAVAEGLGAN